MNDELALLNLTILMPEVWGKFRQDVHENLFVNPEAKLIAEACHYLLDEAGSLSFGVLNLRLRELDLIGKGVSPETLASMINPADILDVHIWGQYLESIQKARLRDSFDNFMYRMAKAQADPEYNDDPSRLFSLALSELNAFQHLHRNDDILYWKQSFEFTRQMDLERAEQEKLGPSVYQWPWKSWNRYIDPLEPSAVVEIAGGTGIGKTIFAECLADYWASRGANVAFFHLELSKKMMMDRRLCRWAKVERRKLLNPSTRTDPENERIADTERRVRTWPGTITYQPCAGWNVDKIRSRAEELRDSAGVDVVILDHMKKLQPSPRQMRLKMETNARQGDDMEQMKILAEHDMRVVILNQMRKSGRELDIDSMSENDIEGSAQQSNLVNIIILLNRPVLKDGRYSATGEMLVEPGGRDTITELKIVKNTMGSHGRWNMLMKPEHFSIFDIKET